jgi:hypothetical protein
LGAWFEILLYGWLKDVGIPEPQPLLHGCLPDFAVRTRECYFVVEAKALLEDEDEVILLKRTEELMESLKGVKAPFVVKIGKCRFGRPLRTEVFRTAVEEWLRSDPIGRHTYFDEDNEISIEASKCPGLAEVSVFAADGEARGIDPQYLRPSLKKKAKQHRPVRRAGYPYVIALFVESSFYGPETAVEAWFGSPSYSINRKTSKVEPAGLDGRGLYYFRREVRHRSISGTLLMKSGWNTTKDRRSLVGWYVENPYAKKPLSPGLFPTESNYVVLSQGERGIRMGWTNNLNRST